MDIKLLIYELNSVALTLVSSRLYDIRYNYIVQNDNILLFKDKEKHDLFYIYLNEFINTEFKSPLNGQSRVTLFQLFIDYCEQYSYNESFKRYLDTAYSTKDFFFKKRYYKYYISPYTINFEISFADFINFQANYSKHSFYHLDNLKKKLKTIFKENGVENFENENYNSHLAYFKEAVLDDRLEFNQTHFLVVLGDLFLAFWDLINSHDNARIRKTQLDFIQKHGRLAMKNINQPDNMTDIEKFHWNIKGFSSHDRERLENFLPQKDKNFPIEEETSKTNMIKRDTMDY